MTASMAKALDAILGNAVSGAPRVPGVAAVVTDRSGTLYEGAAGVRMLGGDPSADAAMTPDSVCAIFSATKAVTAAVCLQLVEEGLLDLDAPARDYAPEIGALQVIDGFGADGTPRLRPPRREVTTRMLLLHTAGFGYDFFNETYARLVRDRRQPRIITALRAAITTPLLFDPGEQWEYGSSMDWAGQVVEGVTGRRLGEAMQQRIFAPLGMADTAFILTPAMRERLARIHQREADGSLRPLADLELPQEPEVHMGGHGLYSTVLDYARFMRMWLNDGAGPHGAVLRPETVAMAARSGLGDLAVRRLPSQNPKVTHDVEFFPGVRKSWSPGFMVNEEPAPTGRPAGSLAWAGIANVYYWIDRSTGIAGVWATQLFPFMDPASLGGFEAFEAAVYDAVKERTAQPTTSA